VRRIYLDNNATTPVVPEVLDAMLPYWSDKFGNASSMHQEGRLARRAIETARDTIAERLDASPEQVIFTSGGTEANNLAILGFAGQPPGRLVTSSIEHPSVLGCFDLLERRGFHVQRAPVDRSGVVCRDLFFQLLTPDTRLASVMLVNNETGAIQPVVELAAAARGQGALFHCDAVQAVGRMPVSFPSLGVNALSLSAHKFHGPLGVGALIVDRKDSLQPVLTGGHQEMGLRPGTEPVALIVGMAKALEIAAQSLEPDSQRIRQLRDYLEHGLRERLPSVIINAPGHACVANTLNVRIPNLDAQAAVVALDLHGVACSTGSACASGAPTPSHALLAIGLSDEEARSSLRFSLSRLTARSDLELALDLVTQVVRDQQTTAAFSASA
jgi:cysteine sulfinate desulfinase/cysteine desulfurase-like protein